MRSAYRSVLRRGDVLSALVPYVLARLPLTMAPLALLLLTQTETGSYHRAGLVCGAYAIAVAIGGPVMGRLVDRHGQGPVLLGTGLIHPAAMIAAAVAAERGAYPLLLVAAVAAGASLPPVAACMRVLWTRLLPDAESRKAGFAIEGVIVEFAELSGPLLISLLLVLGRPATAVWLAGILMGVAALAFRTSRASRDVPRSPATPTRWGALAHRGVRRLLLVVATSTATIGAVEVTVTSYARHHGGLASAGLYIGLISVGGIVAGLLFGGSQRLGNRRGPAMLAAVLALSAATAAVLSVTTAPVVAIFALVAFGAAVAVGVVVQLATMSAVADEAVRTEAFTWGGTANFVGLGLGTAFSGWAVDRFGTSTAFLLAAAPSVVAVVITLVSRSALTAVAEPAHADKPVVDDVEEAPIIESDTALEDEGIRIIESVVTLDDADVHVVDLPVEADDEEVRVIHPDPAIAADLAAARAHVADLEAALAEALNGPTNLIDDAQERSRRMLDRADAACLELRERAEDDAERVRSAATNASLEILAAAERDARALLERARRDADGILARARRAAETAEAPRPTLHALPAVDDGHVDDGDGLAAHST